MLFADVICKGTKFKIKCGFKYIDLDPPIKLYSGAMIYKNISYPFQRKFCISFMESDIIQETMMMIKLKNCNILSSYSYSKREDCKFIYDKDLYLMPILDRTNSKFSARCEFLIVHNIDDFILFNIKENLLFDENDITHDSFNLVINGNIQISPDIIWDRFKELDIHNFSFSSNEMKLAENNFPVIRKFYLSKLLYNRFYLKYKNFLNVKKENLIMEVIDLDELNSINFFTSDNKPFPLFQNTDVFNIKYDRIEHCKMENLKQIRAISKNDRYRYMVYYLKDILIKNNKLNGVVSDDYFPVYMLLIRFNQNKIDYYTKKFVFKSLYYNK